MKIKISDDARKHGFTDKEAGRIGKGLGDRLAGRFAVTDIGIAIRDWQGEAEFQITGSTPNHGDQQCELRMTLNLFDGLERDDILTTIVRSAYECLDRDLGWIESGRCLGTPSTAQLAAAQEFLGEHLRAIETAWLEANE